MWFEKLRPNKAKKKTCADFISDILNFDTKNVIENGHNLQFYACRCQQMGYQNSEN